ncbi:hypothetical protein HanPSC8_Chr17g0777411 [Helianthus annuus]|nr:hypothetical protein HanPSC8_Chr17g0777411 [Helianthus annuus]
MSLCYRFNRSVRVNTCPGTVMMPPALFESARSFATGFDVNVNEMSIPAITLEISSSC